ncbi:hypothetical protein ABGB17_38640, partial [Sphaerisporangium sp. B11E5]
MQPSRILPSGRTARGRRSPAVIAMSVVVALATVMAAVLTWAVPASAAAPLVSQPSGRCLDAAGNSSTQGTALQIWDCGGQAGQSY